jgi:hypothetical protein
VCILILHLALADWSGVEKLNLLRKSGMASEKQSRRYRLLESFVIIIDFKKAAFFDQIVIS